MFDIDIALDIELSKTKPDDLHLSTLKQMKDERGLSLEKFSDTGRFANRELFLMENPKANLHSQCTDVVYYVGGFYIQALKDNTFFADLCGYKIVNKSLDSIEGAVWEIFLENYFNTSQK
jgi:hypothetical protein